MTWHIYKGTANDWQNHFVKFGNHYRQSFYWGKYKSMMGWRILRLEKINDIGKKTLVQITYKKKFIFASSQMSNMNYSNYGILKLIGEKISKTTNGLVVKFWNVYGLEKDISKSHVITDFILMAIKNKKINLKTSLKFQLVDR